MLQKILKVGSSAAVTIPKNSLHGLGVSVGDRVNVVVDEIHHTVTIKPEREKARPSNARQERVARLTLDFINRYRKDLEGLAQK